MAFPSSKQFINPLKQLGRYVVDTWCCVALRVLLYVLVLTGSDVSVAAGSLSDSFFFIFISHFDRSLWSVRFNPQILITFVLCARNMSSQLIFFTMRLTGWIAFFVSTTLSLFVVVSSRFPFVQASGMMFTTCFQCLSSSMSFFESSEVLDSLHPNQLWHQALMVKKWNGLLQ